MAAKLQQDAERNLTRAFLYHAVQEDRGPEGEERTKLEKRLASFRKINDPEFADDIRSIEAQLAGNAVPIPWTELVDRFAQQSELREFATDVWRERARGGREMANEPSKLAEMFLYRELFRRPKVQNNAETMGLLRLSFPKLEEKALVRLPRALEDAGIDADGWLGLALTAVDFVFRDQLATRITPDWMIRFVSPRTDANPIPSADPVSTGRIALQEAGRGPLRIRTLGARHAYIVFYTRSLEVIGRKRRTRIGQARCSHFSGLSLPRRLPETSAVALFSSISRTQPWRGSTTAGSVRSPDGSLAIHPRVGHPTIQIGCFLRLSCRARRQPMQADWIPTPAPKRFNGARPMPASQICARWASGLTFTIVS